MSDIVEQLRQDGCCHGALCDQAADTIERLRAALQEIVYAAGMPIDIPPEDMLANAGATAMLALNPAHSAKG